MISKATANNTKETEKSAKATKKRLERIATKADEK